MINQYDIYHALGHKEFEYKDFRIIFPNTLKPKDIWNRIDFDDRDILFEYLFFHYKPNFYPRPGGWWRDREGQRFSEFSRIKLNFESLIKEREEMLTKSPR